VTLPVILLLTMMSPLRVMLLRVVPAYAGLGCLAPPAEGFSPAARFFERALAPSPKIVCFRHRYFTLSDVMAISDRCPACLPYSKPVII
jgi:hypothetical protein